VPSKVIKIELEIESRHCSGKPSGCHCQWARPANLRHLVEIDASGMLELLQSSVTGVPDDDPVEDPFEAPCDEHSGTRTPPTPEVSPSRALPPPATSLRDYCNY
jgi:hypothetical protein